MKKFLTFLLMFLTISSVVYYKNGTIVGADVDTVFDLAVGKKHIFEFSGYKNCGADEYKIFVNKAHTWW